MLRRCILWRCTTPPTSTTSVALVPTVAMKAQWGFLTKSQGFVPMSDADSAIVEHAFDPTGTRSRPWPITANQVALSNGHVYDFVFDRRRMTQVNTSTKKRRHLQRTMVAATTTPASITSTPTGSGAALRKNLAAYVFRGKSCRENPSPFCTLFVTLRAAGLQSVDGLEDAAHHESAKISYHNGSQMAEIQAIEHIVRRRTRKLAATFGPVGKDIALLELIGNSFRRCVRRSRALRRQQQQRSNNANTNNSNTAATATTTTTTPLSPGDTLKQKLGEYPGKAKKGIPRYPFTALSEVLSTVGWQVPSIDELAKEELQHLPRLDQATRRAVKRRIRRSTLEHGTVGKDMAVMGLISTSFRKAVRQSR